MVGYPNPVRFRGLTPKQREAKRIAALEDTDYQVLALIGVAPEMFVPVKVATHAGQPIFAWHLNGANVQRSVERLKRLRWIRGREKLELRIARTSNRLRP